MTKKAKISLTVFIVIVFTAKFKMILTEKIRGTQNILSLSQKMIFSTR